MEYKDAFTNIVAVNEARLLRYASRMVSDDHIGEDIVQDAFRQYLKYFGNNKKAAVNPDKWLFKTVHNIAIDYIRSKKIEAKAVEELAKDTKEGVEDASLKGLEMKDMLVELYKRLPDDMREVISLKLEQGYSYKEISDITGHKPGYVGYLIHHAVKKMKENLATEDTEK